MQAAVRAETMSNADVELAERHRAGDRTAFDEVYAAYSDMVFNVALRMSGNVDDASDGETMVFMREYPEA